MQRTIKGKYIRSSALMASFDNENLVSEYVTDLEITQEKEEVPLAAGGRGGEEEAIASEPEGEEDLAGENNEHGRRYVPLLKATLKGDWESAKGMFDKDKGALTAKITKQKGTALHVAVASGRSIDFVKKLVARMSAEALERPNIHGWTALHNAAYFGNTEAANILVQKNRALLYIRSNRRNRLPLHMAAAEGHKDTLLYLLKVTEDDLEYLPFAYPSGVKLLLLAVGSKFYDIALALVHHYPQLATQKAPNGKSALEVMSYTPSFRSGSHLNCWQRLIYDYVPVELENYADEHYNKVRSLLIRNQNIVIGSTVHRSTIISPSPVPFIKCTLEQKLMHLQALQLVKCLCQIIISSNDSNSYASFYKDPILEAARLGTHEFVEAIVESFPAAIWSADSEKHNIFQLAVLHRNENVFNLRYQMSEYKHDILHRMADSGNTILHLAGRLAPHAKLNLIPSAAMQMQRELQWFKEAHKFITPSYREQQNNEHDTPAMVFSKQHKKLVEQGEKWLKDTANSCTIAAALIATIAFAASITVPGGSNGTSGLPIFFKERAFIVFIVSNAISLFTSTTSLLMFLSILTSRFAEGDFLYVLPTRLIIGLFTLFLSISTMIVAFSSTIYLVGGHIKAWILIPVVALACLPIISFISLQFPLLVDLISSTYGRGIFGKQSDQPFY